MNVELIVDGYQTIRFIRLCLMEYLKSDTNHLFQNIHRNRHSSYILIVSPLNHLKPNHNRSMQ